MPASDEARSPISTGSERLQDLRVARLVVGYDGSNCANAAAAFGLWLAGKVGCQAIVVNAGDAEKS